jgi:hypothetical protein
MGILNALFKGLSRQKTIIWGLRVPQSARKKWQLQANLMGIPANRLILYILQDWVRQNAELLVDEQARSALAGRIVDAYLRNELK